MRALIVALFLVACSRSESATSGADRSGRVEVAEAPAVGTAHNSRIQSHDELVRNTYEVAYDLCEYSSESVYKEAGSRNVHEAAEWYSKGSKEGPHRVASYRGCADALMGREKRF